MGRPKRVTARGIVYHVLNRANRRARIFNKPRDYDGFLKTLVEGLARFPSRLLALRLTPNHWHPVLGEERWTQETARRLGIVPLRRRGRPLRTEVLHDVLYQ